MKSFHVDTFTDKLFTGNPAMVCMQPQLLSNHVLQKIAAENNLPATVFLQEQNGQFNIRWFTPEEELSFCGHGTLAAAHVIFYEIFPDLPKVTFISNLNSFEAKRGDNLIFLTLPEKNMQSCAPNAMLLKALGVPSTEQCAEARESLQCSRELPRTAPLIQFQESDESYIAVVETENIVKQLNPVMPQLQSFPYRRIIITAPADNPEVDFVSRTFYPKKAVQEDPVTGASHCLLVSYWSKRLGKSSLIARQISARGGTIYCEYQKENQKVILGGKAILYAKETINFSGKESIIK